jgi:uroporphyrinogen-III synthase
MNNHSLQGKTVLLTRPGAMTDELGDRIKHLRGRPLYLPSMLIAPAEKTAVSASVLENLQRFDILIFVSRNAVKYACNLIPDLLSRISNQLVFAIGAGTCEELKRRGFAKARFSDGNTGSETLLRMSELQATRVAGKKILILRGTGGRELLREELSRRGAKIEYADLYQRVLPDLPASEVKKVWLEEKPDVVQITSAEGLANLLQMTSENERPLFLNTRLIVISPRLKTVAESTGFSGEIRISRSYSDDDFILALTEMFEATENE